MYAHGYMMFPDYLALGILVATLSFLLSLIAVALGECLNEVYHLWEGVKAGGGEEVN